MDEKNNASVIKTANAVGYSIQNDLNLVKRRTTKRQVASVKTIEASPVAARPYIEFPLSLHAEYVDSVESYLKFKIEYNTSLTTGVSNTTPGKLSSGFTDFFRSIQIVDRFGNVLEDIQNGLHHICSFMATSTHDNAYLHHTTYVFPADKTLTRTPSINLIVIPLHFLCGLFKTNRLIPPHVLDGARVRLGVRSANAVFSPTAADVLDESNQEGWEYTITDPEIVFSTYVLDDRLHEMLTHEYETTGLQFSFYSHYTLSKKLPTAGVTDTINITQPFSRASGVVGCIERYANDAWQDAYYDLMFPTKVPGPYVYKSYVARVGDVQIPDNPVESNWLELFHLWVAAFRKHRSGGISSEAHRDFLEGQRFIVDTNRQVVGGDPSGQQINHTFPVAIATSLEAAETCTSEITSVSAVLGRRLQLFVHHQRVVLAQAGGHKLAV